MDHVTVAAHEAYQQGEHQNAGGNGRNRDAERTERTTAPTAVVRRLAERLAGVVKERLAL